MGEIGVVEKDRFYDNLVISLVVLGLSGGVGGLEMYYVYVLFGFLEVFLYWR